MKIYLASSSCRLGADANADTAEDVVSSSVYLTISKLKVPTSNGERRTAADCATANNLPSICFLIWITIN